MSSKKKHYPFTVTDRKTKHVYRVVFSALWKVERHPKPKVPSYSYCVNVFRANFGWVGGSSFVEIGTRPGQNEAIFALQKILEYEGNNGLVAEDATEQADESVVAQPVEDVADDASDEANADDQVDA